MPLGFHWRGVRRATDAMICIQFAKDIYRQINPDDYWKSDADTVVYEGLTAAQRWVDFA